MSIHVKVVLQLEGVEELYCSECNRILDCETDRNMKHLVYPCKNCFRHTTKALLGEGALDGKE